MNTRHRRPAPVGRPICLPASPRQDDGRNLNRQRLASQRALRAPGKPSTVLALLFRAPGKRSEARTKISSSRGFLALPRRHSRRRTKRQRLHRRICNGPRKHATRPKQIVRLGSTGETFGTKEDPKEIGRVRRAIFILVCDRRMHSTSERHRVVRVVQNDRLNRRIRMGALQCRDALLRSENPVQTSSLETVRDGFRRVVGVCIREEAFPEITLSHCCYLVSQSFAAHGSSG